MNGNTARISSSELIDTLSVQDVKDSDNGSLEEKEVSYKNNSILITFSEAVAILIPLKSKAMAAKVLS